MLWLFEAFLEYVRQQGIYIYRGDPVNLDFTVVDFTDDNAWHELNVSTFVPANAKAIDVVLVVRNLGAGRTILLRRAGQINDANVATLCTQAANVPCAGDLTIPVDSDRKFEYKLDAGNWVIISFTVKGWWY